MLKLFKQRRDRICFCGSKYVIESKYRLFYISEAGEDILACRVPVNILQIDMHRPYGKDIYGNNVVSLSEGDIIRVTVHNYYVNSRMSIMERAGAISTRYIRYKGEGNFEELSYEGRKVARKIAYITLFKL